MQLVCRPQAETDDGKTVIKSPYGFYSGHCELVIIWQFHGRAGNLAKKLEYGDGVFFLESAIFCSENVIKNTSGREKI